jgi:hypothetical protein
VKFYSGKISPRQIAIRQISRGLLSKSPRKFGAIESLMNDREWEIMSFPFSPLLFTKIRFLN